MKVDYNYYQALLQFHAGRDVIAREMGIVIEIDFARYPSGLARVITVNTGSKVAWSTDFTRSTNA